MKLIAYNSSESGGMMGGYSSISITYTEDGRCKVKSAKKSFHSDPTRKVTYYADGLLEKLSEVCERFDVANWGNLDGEKIFMHDASSKTDNFTFENRKTIVLESGMIYPEYVREMSLEVKRLIQESESYGVDFEVTEEAQMGMPFGMMGSMQMMNGQVAQADNNQNAGSQGEDVSTWAKFCGNCGAKFTGTQKFCAECGSVREKR